MRNDVTIRMWLHTENNIKDEDFVEAGKIADLLLAMYAMKEK